ncbi:unnamed protein product [Paramecium sonneborni]|uniref:Transmembrane protein n=1 Tax=Paramecium sonneborni TaxID=65129 RepID=A0A8S1RQR0_9CILI|nr:unnamed protein product [Paramecium sonneborni]
MMKINKESQDNQWASKLEIQKMERHVFQPCLISVKIKRKNNLRIQHKKLGDKTKKLVQSNVRKQKLQEQKLDQKPYHLVEKQILYTQNIKSKFYILFILLYQIQELVYYLQIFQVEKMEYPMRKKENRLNNQKIEIKILIKLKKKLINLLMKSFIGKRNCE